ncbi:nucleoside phosphorylase domain-containing protein [Delphinella strobiligena]|nr:nucleoside phosphorylase domain-containing protein [Delphinella strobiligena]
MTSPPVRSAPYRIGIICALPVEKAAVMAVLEEDHPSLPNHPGDDNDYSFGRLGTHNVAIACLPAGLVGKASAATAAKDMGRTFSIEFGLMVGIGGGVWSRRSDVRLGDIVVSQPDGKHGGVVQWDFGKMEKGGSFRRTGLMNNPPRVLLNAMQSLKTKHMMWGDNLSEHLSKISAKMPYMAQIFAHQGAENEQLFQVEYSHQGGETCEECDAGQLMDRLPLRTSTRPRIHYGNIASGDEVIKDSVTRDRIAKEEGVICFEMEAAGLMNNFPYLVIRGICDYADSHKNKRWQPYAAAVAAAYAKELLSIIPEQDTAKLQNDKHCMSFPAIS